MLPKQHAGLIKYKAENTKEQADDMLELIKIYKIY
jgi:hypothetical protein